MSELTNLRDVSMLDGVLAVSGERPVLIFKHSAT